MTTTTTYTALINLYAHHLTGLRDELMNIAQFPLTAARNSLIAINNAVELACHDAGKNWGPILSEGVNIKAASRAKFIQRITEALEGLEGLKAALIKYSGEDARQAKAEAEADQVSTCFTRGSDVLHDNGVRLTLPVCTDQSPESHQTVESEFITRIVTALDDAPMGTHGVYVHWFRIDYGCWLDAEEVANAGGLVGYLESLGMSEDDIEALLTRDWDYQDAEGLASHCIGDYGSFNWEKLGNLLAVSVPADVLSAGLACEITPDEIEERYMGEWDRPEDMAYDMWEQSGMLEQIPSHAHGYIDWQAVARDMGYNGEYVEHNHHFFRSL